MQSKTSQCTLARCKFTLISLDLFVVDYLNGFGFEAAVIQLVVS
jgi:hypothetical protein